MAPQVSRLFLSLSCVGLLVAAATLGGTPLGLAAPLSGEVYEAADSGGGERVPNPYGEASVRFDDAGVPHIEAENERALFFAVGYVQARDRLFQMDLQRRLVGGNLSAAVGERALESDRFYRRLDFRGAAEASWDSVEGSAAGPSVEAYAAGVNHYIEAGDLPPEFALLDYRPSRWTPTDTLLVAKLVSWRLSGSFADLRRATMRDRLGERASELTPARLDHGVPVIRGESDAVPFDPEGVVNEEAAAVDDRGRVADDRSRVADGDTDFSGLYDALSRYDRERGIGSNNWVVAGEHTESGSPILANDPHLSLTVPALWYEMHLTAPELETRGVAFPGIPYVVIGRTADVAWGVTNVGGDFTDVYAYESRDGEYRLGDEWRAYDVETETIPVSDGPDAEVVVRKTVHGPVVERAGREVAVAWTGFSATNESLAAYRLNRADSVADVRRALTDWDVPAQNFVAADRDGATLYHPAGKYPIRVTDGEVVRGDRVFDGSAREGQWRGFDPYGRSNWSGFVPFESLPHLDDPGYVATANQRLVDDAGFYVGADFSSPYRGQRIYDRLDERVGGGGGEGVGQVDPAFTRDLQRDVYSTAADGFVGYAVGGIGQSTADGAAFGRALRSWDREMRADSRGALVFALWLEEFRNATFHDEFASAGLDRSYYPRDYVLQTLPRDSDWYDDETTTERETRVDVAALALTRAAARADRAGYETYGDYNRLQLTHPFDQSFLNFPEAPMDGSTYTVNNFRRGGDTQAGSSWRMVVTFGDGESGGVVPGGQSGVFWSEHYHDQLDEWRAGEYKPLTLSSPAGDPDIVFVEGSS